MPSSRRTFLQSAAATVVLGPFLWLAEVAAQATVAQLGPPIEPGRRYRELRLRWKDLRKKTQVAEFRLKNRLVRRDLRPPKRLSIEAMLRNAWLQLRGAVVSIEGHAFAAIDLRPKGSQLSVPIRRRARLAVEPVGPARAPLGTLAPSSIQWMATGFDVRVVPTARI